MIKESRDLLPHVTTCLLLLFRDSSLHRSKTNRVHSFVRRKGSGVGPAMMTWDSWVSDERHWLAHHMLLVWTANRLHTARTKDAGCGGPATAEWSLRHHVTGGVVRLLYHDACDTRSTTWVVRLVIVIKYYIGLFFCLFLLFSYYYTGHTSCSCVTNSLLMSQMLKIKND